MIGIIIYATGEVKMLKNSEEMVPTLAWCDFSQFYLKYFDEGFWMQVYNLHTQIWQLPNAQDCVAS